MSNLDKGITAKDMYEEAKAFREGFRKRIMHKSLFDKARTLMRKIKSMRVVILIPDYKHSCFIGVHILTHKKEQEHE